MTGPEFTGWLLDMRVAGLAYSDAACGRLLGVSSNSVLTMKRDGTTNRRTDLACAALLARLRPYPESE